MRAPAWILVLIACSEDPPARRARPEPEPEVEAPVEEHGSVLVVPAGWRAEGLVEARPYAARLGMGDGGDTFPDIVHPQLDVRRRLNAMIRAWMREGRDGEEPLDSARCEATIATETLVGVLCTYAPFENRGGGTFIALSAHYRIEGARIEPFDLADEITDPDTLIALANERCVAGTPVSQSWDGTPEEWRLELEDECQPEWTVALEPAGVRLTGILGDAAGYGPATSTVHLTFAQIGDILRADGPLAELRELAPGMTTAQAPVRSAPSGIERMAVSEIAYVDELAAAWLELPLEERAQIALARLRFGAAVLVHLEGDRGAAAPIARRLGSSVRAVRSPWEPLRLSFVRAEQDLAMRPHPHRMPIDDEGTLTDPAPALAILPNGTRLVALRGSIDHYTSELGRDGQYVRAVANEATSGWVSADQVVREEGCAIDPAAFLARLPEDRRIEARVSLVRAATMLSQRNVLLFAASAGGQAYAGAFETADGCTAGEPIREAHVEGVASRVALVRTGALEGDPLLVIGTTARTAVFHAAAAPVWELGHGPGEWEDVEVAHVDGERYCPIAVGDACFVWQNGRLQEP